MVVLEHHFEMHEPWSMGALLRAAPLRARKQLLGWRMGDLNFKWPSWLSSFDRPRDHVCFLWRLGRLSRHRVSFRCSLVSRSRDGVSVEGWRRRLRPRFLVSRWLRSFQPCRPAGDGLEEHAPTTAGEPGSAPCRGPPPRPITIGPSQEGNLLLCGSASYSPLGPVTPG